MRTECFLEPQVYCSTTMVLIRLFCLDVFLYVCLFPLSSKLLKERYRLLVLKIFP